jgi:hypothetical protein
MKTNIVDRDLTKQPPHSPTERFGGFAILGRTIDKCRASINGQLGEYHYDCPLDNQLFGFKGVNADKFKNAIAGAKTYEDVAAWLQANGKQKTPTQIEDWSDKVEAAQLTDVFAGKSASEKKELMEACQKMDLDYETTTLFEWLDADDQASFEPQAHTSEK